ncbi:MAG: SIS domain-containing protein [Sedimentisphaerales bacterium]|nr:SIS domain-containing protein [Sedimentisphaerales bacterium]
MPDKNTHAPPLPDDLEIIVTQVCNRFEHLKVSAEGLRSACRAITETIDAGGMIYLCGNGGSFADAMHIKGELAKSFCQPRPLTDKKVIANLQATEIGQKLIGLLEQGLPVIVLGESHSLRSAFENDCDAELSYAQELNAFAGHIPGGLLFGISTSGNARNVIAAMTLARAYGMTTVSFTGQDGGRIAKLADIAWRVPGYTTHEIQENQIPLYHALCLMVELYFFG